MFFFLVHILFVFCTYLYAVYHLPCKNKIMLFQTRQPPFLSIRASCKNGCKRTVFSEKNKCPQTLPIFCEMLDYHVWGDTLKKNNVLQAKPKMTDELKSPCRRSGKSCLQNTLTRCWRASSNCTAYIAVVANGGQSKHLQQLCPSPSLHPYLITNKPALSEPTTDYR